jgi:Zn-dependent protease with chaperone function
MITPYVFRLLCLSLAAFFVVHAAVGLPVSLAVPWAIRMAGRLRPRLAASLLLGLRMLPPGLAIFVVVGLCVPSYLWLEPEAVAEDVGFWCLAAALLTAAIWGISAVKALHATVLSLRHARRWQCAGRRTRIPGAPFPVLVIDAPAPLLALAGIFRSQVIVSRRVLSVLPAGQMAAALRHEQAHRASHDNLKRLLLLLAPGILPMSHGLGALERAWVRFAEWAADDESVAGDGRRALLLAAALVRVARLGGTSAQMPLAASILADSADLEARVDRLLYPVRQPVKLKPQTPVLTAAAALTLTVSLAAVTWLPATLSRVHRLLEHLNK